MTEKDLQIQQLQMQVKELDKYRRAEAEGRLVVLPCKVGDELWFEKDGRIQSFMNVRQRPKDYKPCIITPGTNKYEKTSQLPYRELMQQMDDVFKSTSGFLCIGYGFNDKHVHPNLLGYSQKRNKPILIITKDITNYI